ncbi:MAG: hypothetical protein IPJ36_17355 [Simplicispira sp.]|nr:hypothetical protein [Simplicispira sp.]
MSFQQDAVTLKEMRTVGGAAIDFNLLSRQITANFAGRHKGQMSAAVFCRSHRSVPSDRTIAGRIGPSDQDGQ